MMERLSEDSNEETIMQARAEVEQCGFLLQELY
jgi:hypothetical protein